MREVGEHYFYNLYLFLSVYKSVSLQYSKDFHTIFVNTKRFFLKKKVVYLLKIFQWSNLVEQSYWISKSLLISTLRSK